MEAFVIRFLDHVVPLSDGIFLIGRSRECNLAIDDKMISRRHLVLHVMNGCIELEDCGSRNGATINGTPLRSRQRLADGDLIKLGRHELRLAVLDVTRRDARRTNMTMTRRIRRSDSGRRASDESDPTEPVEGASAIPQDEDYDTATNTTLVDRSH